MLKQGIESVVMELLYEPHKHIGSIIEGSGDLHHDQRAGECQPLCPGTVVNGPEVERPRLCSKLFDFVSGTSAKMSAETPCSRSHRIADGSSGIVLELARSLASIGQPVDGIRRRGTDAGEARIHEAGV